MVEAIYTPTEAAQKLRMARSTLYRYLAEGMFEVKKVKGRWKLPESTLQAFIDQTAKIQK